MKKISTGEKPQSTYVSFVFSIASLTDVQRNVGRIRMLFVDFNARAIFSATLQGFSVNLGKSYTPS